MARITWQNVTAPDLSTSRVALQQAGNSLSSGFQGFADSFRDIEQQQKDAYSQEALARLAQVSDPNQLNSMMASDGLAALGIEDPRYLNADAMQSILGRSKTLFDNQNTAANTADTQSTMNRRNRLLDGEVRQQGATYDSTIAGTALTKQQTEAAKQNILNTKSIIEARKAKLEADKKLWTDEDTKRDFESAAQTEIKEANEFSAPYVQAAKQIDDPELLRKYLADNQADVFKNPKKVNAELLEIYDKGAMYAEPDFTANQTFTLNQAGLKTTSDARNIATRIINNPQATTKEEALAIANTIPELQQAPKLLEAVISQITEKDDSAWTYPEALSASVRKTPENEAFDRLFTDATEILSWDTGTNADAFINGVTNVDPSEATNADTIVKSLLSEGRPDGITNDSWTNGRGAMLKGTQRLLAKYKGKVPASVIEETIKATLTGRSNLYLALVDWNDTDSILINFKDAEKRLDRLADPAQRNQMARTRSGLAERKADLERIGNDRARVLAQKERAVSRASSPPTDAEKAVIANYDTVLSQINAQLESILGVQN